MMIHRILFVDPSPTYARIVPWEFSQLQDLDVKGVSSGREALDLIERWVPHLLLVAVTLNDMAPPDLAGEVARRYGLRCYFTGTRVPAWMSSPEESAWIDKGSLSANLLRTLAPRLD